jgi:hypothetical protein
VSSNAPSRSAVEALRVTPALSKGVTSHHPSQLVEVSSNAPSRLAVETLRKTPALNEEVTSHHPSQLVEVSSTAPSRLAVETLRMTPALNEEVMSHHPSQLVEVSYTAPSSWAVENLRMTLALNVKVISPHPSQLVEVSSFPSRLAVATLKMTLGMTIRMTPVMNEEVMSPHPSKRIEVSSTAPSHLAVENLWVTPALNEGVMCVDQESANLNDRLTGVSVEVGEALANAVMPPPPAPIVGTFYPTEDFDDVTAIRIREHCVMQEDHVEQLQLSVMEGIEAAGIDHCLHGSELFAALCYISELSRRRVAVVDPSFSAAHHYQYAANEELRSRTNLYGRIDDFEVVLIPIAKFNASAEENVDLFQSTGHWVIGIYEVSTRSLFHYDSLQLPLDEDTKKMYRKAVATLRQLGEPELTCRILTRPFHTYNKQEDAVSCGFFIYFFAELYLLRGRDGTLLAPFGPVELDDQRRRIVEHVAQIFLGMFPPYQAPPLSNRRALPAPVSTPVQVMTTPVGPRRSERIRERDERRQLEEETRQVVTVEGDSRPTFQATGLRPLIRMTRVCSTHNHPGEGCFSMSVNHKVDAYVAGDFDQECNHCGAWVSMFEKTKQKCSKCCAKGRVDLAERFAAYQDRPQVLQVLSDLDHPRGKEFRRLSRKCNAEMAFGSTFTNEEFLPATGAPVCRVNNETSYNLSDLYTSQGVAPKFGEHYCIDPEDSLQWRVQSVVGAGLNPDWLRLLDNMLREVNPLCQLYKSASERIAEARGQNADLPRYRLTLLNDREAGPALDPSAHSHTTNLPVANQVGMIWVDDGNEVPEHRGVWLEGRGQRGYVKLQRWDPNLEPICFPLLFPRGQQGWTLGIRTSRHALAREADDNEVDENADALTVGGQDDAVDDDNILAAGPDAKRQVRRGEFVSMREFWRSMFQLRGGPSFSKSPHWLMDMGKLAEFFSIDVLNRIERREMEAYKDATGDKRATSAPAYVEALERGLQPGEKLGRIFQMPNSWVGSRSYMEKQYANLLTIARYMGRPPDFFVTFTMNPESSAVKNSLKPGEDPMTRPDVIIRVWEELSAEFFKDLMERDVLGKVVAYAKVLEHQKRGFPHNHILLWVEETPDKGTPEWVNRYISAEIPDLPEDDDRSEAAEQMRRLHRIITTQNLHTCTERTGCWVNGKCTKRFPKKYSYQTVLSSGQFPLYSRRPPRLDSAEEAQVSDAPQEVEDFDEDDVETAEYQRRPPMPSDQHVSETSRSLYGNTVKKMHGRTLIEYTNARVVPYNRGFSLKYDAHVNVEYVGGANVCKYICKYFTKGQALAYVRVGRERVAAPQEQGASQQPAPSVEQQQTPINTEQPAPDQVGAEPQNSRVVDYDEFAHHFKVCYRTATEAIARLYSLPIMQMSHPVVLLYVHKPGEKTVVFEDENEEAANMPTRDSPLEDYFKLNRRDPDAADLTFFTVHQRYRLLNGKWIKRSDKAHKTLCRIGRVPPKDLERQAIRMLLAHIAGPKDWLDLRRLPGQDEPCATFVEAARRRGLFESNVMWIQTLEQAADEMMSASRFRHCFATLIFNAEPPDPRPIFDAVLDYLCPPALENDNVDERRKRALHYIEYALRTLNSSCIAMGLGEPVDYNHEQMEAEVERQDAYLPANVGEIGDTDAPAPNRSSWASLVERNLALFADNPEQRLAYDTIMGSIHALVADSESDVHRHFMLDGPGGCGKTLLLNTIIATILSENGQVEPCATTGIAGILMIRGGTAHTKLWIPTELDANTPPRLEYNNTLAQRIRRANLIIIDEVSILHRDALSFIDRQLRDVMPRHRSHLPFGGVPILLSGDFRQGCPVVPHSGPLAQRDASVKSSSLFRDNFRTLKLTKNMRTGPGEQEFASWLMEVGNGSNLIDGNFIEIPEECVANDLDTLIRFCFDDAALADPIANATLLCNNAILAPKNDDVAAINARINKRLPGESRTYLGFDYVTREGPLDRLSIYVEDRNIEQIHEDTPPGLPPYKLELKVGSIIMLIKNFDLPNGLCNGTRLQIIQLLDDLLKCRILTGGMRANQEASYVFLPRVKFEHGTKRGDIFVGFKRIQFPVRLSWAMTITKSQGQTLERVGLALQWSQCFSHGQCYVAVSRVRKRSSLRVLSGAANRSHVINKVDRELLREEPVAEQQEPEVETENDDEVEHDTQEY